MIMLKESMLNQRVRVMTKIWADKKSELIEGKIIKVILLLIFFFVIIGVYILIKNEISDIWDFMLGWFK